MENKGTMQGETRRKSLPKNTVISNRSGSSRTKKMIWEKLLYPGLIDENGVILKLDNAG